ncbi:MAG: M20/M25/M40 family metallo-hydrolase [Chloroflexi bacterium]|nr:M20/M25/M40 family metallo-hydrolase [Chloroflexota bacterium]
MVYNQHTFQTYLATHRERFLDEFKEIIAFPSVAAQKRGIHECADWVVARLEKIGASVQKFQLPNSGSPVIFGEIGNGPRTLLIYNHYDVQPEEPLDQWETSPFELTLKDDRLFGRGVVDDKGELLSRIQALEAWQATQGDLPVKVKFVFEGEEEIGSINLPAWAETHRDILGADGLLWEGGGRDETGKNSMAEGCKGIAYFELRCKGAAYDQHSSIAPIIPNPAWRLVWALSTMKNDRDEITIDGYRDQVRHMPDWVIERIDDLPFESAQIRNRVGLEHWLNGMDDKTALRRYMLEPTLTICGFDSGYKGEGTKTVLPAEAMVKLDCRLVPNLTPHLAQELIRKHLDARGFNDISLTLLGGEEPAMEPQDSLVRRAAIAACQDVFGHEPIISPWFAGSGPMYPLSVMLGIPVISAGATWHPHARAHATNENIFVQDYFDSMHLTAALMRHFAAGQ